MAVHVRFIGGVLDGQEEIENRPDVIRFRFESVPSFEVAQGKESPPPMSVYEYERTVNEGPNRTRIYRFSRSLSGDDFRVFIQTRGQETVAERYQDG